MQFKNPEILYFLFLLLIPVIIHLFQLRRFKKTAFTNVVFLERVVQNTRKSNTLKKWLILLTRLCALAGLILAFAQPFIPETGAALQEQETVLFIDNSFSMQAQGDKGTLLNEVKQDLLANLPKGKTLTLATWDNQSKDFDPAKDRSVLQDLDYTSATLSQENLMLQLKSLFSKDRTKNKRLILVSDFQDLQPEKNPDSGSLNLYNVMLKPIDYSNIALDSLSSELESAGMKFRVWLSATTPLENQVPVSVYNGDQLLTKATANFNNSDTTSVYFSLETQNQIAGKLSIEDPNLNYDNQFYFAAGAPRPLKVLAISNTDSDFISRLYRSPDYELTIVQSAELDYSLLADQNLIVLNELSNIPEALINQLRSNTAQGGTLILIPAADARREIYTPLLGAYGFLPFGEKNTTAQRITSINYDHPLYQNVFSGRTSNLQSHVLQSYFPLTGTGSILGLENGAVFLAESNGLYVFTGALNAGNSNFINGQLIVPTFDKIAVEALKSPRLYYTFGDNATYEIEATLPEDAVLVLENKGDQIIPLQQKRGSKITISETPGLDKAGVYALKHKNDTLALVAYNYNRLESALQEQNFEEHELYDEVGSLINELQEASNLNLLSKWFVIFALFAFLSEMLILKFFK
ncbi:BatA domain-containing protein [Leeuwenhoekiella sp. H156]|uniref:BatA domain-containing protein n=1 Tax=Leeuwenhoekiella sp. H156 TaxID=3450128 RepID=UPI003FA4822B